MFERGFKTWCEKYAIEIRSELGLKKDAPLDGRALAAHLGIRVWTPQDVPGLSNEALGILLRNDGKTRSCWSAVTLVVRSKAVIILNASHSPARQASDLTHELAHRILGHEAQDVSVSEDGLMLLSNYEKWQEDQADWLAGCLLLPREALASVRRRRIDDASAAETYGVSSKMFSYRVAMTGIKRQYA